MTSAYKKCRTMLPSGDQTNDLFSYKLIFSLSMYGSLVDHLLIIFSFKENALMLFWSNVAVAQYMPHIYRTPLVTIVYYMNGCSPCKLIDNEKTD